MWRALVDEQTTQEQREALLALPTGKHGGTYWEIFASVCPHVLEPLVAQISLSVDREKRRASVRISDLAESEIEPIKNPQTGVLEAWSMIYNPPRRVNPHAACYFAVNAHAATANLSTVLARKSPTSCKARLYLLTGSFCSSVCASTTSCLVVSTARFKHPLATTSCSI